MGGGRRRREGQAPTKPRFNINIPLGSGKRAEPEDGLQTDSFFNAKRKKEEELERLRQAQEDTEKGRAAMREKLELERAEQKRQEQQRAEQIAAERRELEQSVESDSFWNPPEEPVDEQESQLSSPYLDDLINRVAPAAHPKIQYAKRRGATDGGFCRFGPPVPPA